MCLKDGRCSSESQTQTQTVLTYLHTAFDLSPDGPVAPSTPIYRLNGRYLQMITRWAFLGLISTNRDGPLHGAAETVIPHTTPTPTSPAPPLSLSLSLSLPPPSQTASAIDPPQLAPGTAAERRC